mgnify:CR=1 FL=1
MLYTIAIASLLIWLLSLLASVTIGGLIHVLPVIAMVVIMLKIFENPCDRWE